MRDVRSLLCFLVLACTVASPGGSVSAQQAGGCTVSPPAPTWTCVNGNWLPPTTPDPTPPAPPPTTQVISVGETVTGVFSADTFDATGFHPGVFEIFYELTALSDGFLTAQLSWDPQSSDSVYLELENVVGSWPPPSIATLQVVAGGTYRIHVSGDYYSLLFASFVLTTSMSVEPPVPVISCSFFQPGHDWLCVNGNWVPPGHPDAQPSSPPPTPPAPAPPTAGPQGCVTATPASTWVCVNGDWLPPGHPGLSAPTAPTPPPAAPSGACTTPDPFIGIPGLVGVCIGNNNWVPIGHPLLGRGGG